MNSSANYICVVCVSVNVTSRASQPFVCAWLILLPILGHFGLSICVFLVSRALNFVVGVRVVYLSPHVTLAFCRLRRLRRLRRRRRSWRS